MIINTELAKSAGHLLSDLWSTPDHIFIPLDRKYQFTLDPCCTEDTKKCKIYYTPTENGLIQNWKHERVFVNPPYSRNNIDLWMKKCFEESLQGTFIVALIPVSSSSKWWHNYVLNHAELQFYERRIRFKGAPFTAPFSSVLAIYNSQNIQKFTSINQLFNP